MRLHHAWLLAAIVVALLPAPVQAELPEGFATYSKGDTYERTLHMVTFGPGMTEEQIVATERQICPRGSHGGDISGHISFDGEWLAFSRSVSADSSGYGGNDFHQWDGWSVHIIKLHQPDATPIQVAGAGSYWPSWGVDSFGETKTLYYGTHYLDGSSKGGTLRAVTVGPDGALTGDREIYDVQAAWPSSFENFVAGSPDGTFVAARWGGAVWVAHYAGPLAGERFRLNGGCFPSVAADSRWIFHATAKQGRFDGSSLGSVVGDGAGSFHFGSSPDLRWYVARTGSADQNCGAAVHLSALQATDEALVTTRQVLITESGSFADVHVWGEPPVPALTSVEIGPREVEIAAAGSVGLTAFARDQLHRPIAARIEWEVAAGGSATPTSSSELVTEHRTTFTSDGSLGRFEVTARSGTVAGRAVVVVVDPAAQTPADDGQEEVVDEGSTATQPPAPAIVLLSPVGGEVLQVGATFAIDWQAQGLFDVVLLYSTDAGETWTPIAPSVDLQSAAWGSYPWAVPDTPSAQCLVRVMGYSGEVPVDSGLFTIARGDEASNVDIAATSAARSTVEVGTGCECAGLASPPGWWGAVCLLLGGWRLFRRRV